MMMTFLNRRMFMAGLAGSAVGRSHAVAAPAEGFYRGKRITLVVGFAPGGGVDTDARVIGRHLPRFIAGEPNILVQNMEGAAGMGAPNYLHQGIAPEGPNNADPGRLWVD